MCRKIVWLIAAFVTACPIVRSGSCDRPREAESAPPAPLALFTYQTMPLSVNVRVAVAVVAEGVPPVLLDTVYVHVADVAERSGVKMNRPLASTDVSDPPVEQLAPVTLTPPAGCTLFRSVVALWTAGVVGAPDAPVTRAACSRRPCSPGPGRSARP